MQSSKMCLGTLINIICFINSCTDFEQPYPLGLDSVLALSQYRTSDRIILVYNYEVSPKSIPVAKRTPKLRPDTNPLLFK